MQHGMHVRAQAPPASSLCMNVHHACARCAQSAQYMVISTWDPLPPKKPATPTTTTMHLASRHAHSRSCMSSSIHRNQLKPPLSHQHHHHHHPHSRCLRSYGVHEIAFERGVACGGEVWCATGPDAAGSGIAAPIHWLAHRHDGARGAPVKVYVCVDVSMSEREVGGGAGVWVRVGAAA